MIKQIAASNVGHGPYACNFSGCTKQGESDLAGDHVDFITVGDRHQHICIFNTCLAQNIGIGASSYDCADVHTVLQYTQAFGICVDNGDVVGFTGKVLSQGSAHLACTENNYFHYLIRASLNTGLFNLVRHILLSGHNKTRHVRPAQERVGGLQRQ